jgi:hypothetical protein
MRILSIEADQGQVLRVQTIYYTPAGGYLPKPDWFKIARWMAGP